MPFTENAASSSVLDRALIRALRQQPLERRALRALLRAHRLLGVVLAQRLAEMRADDDPLLRALGEIHSTEILAQALREALGLLGERFDKLPERRRPHYSPAQRFRILRLRHLLGLNQDETARLFRIAAATVARWEVQANPESQAVGSEVAPVPPVRRYHDVVRHLVQTLAEHGFGGAEKIAEHLARAGWKLAETTVRRILRERRLPDPSAPQAPKRAVVARFVHHVWHLGLTEIPGFLGSAPRLLALVLDRFSRMPLAWTLYSGRPESPDLQKLVDTARSCLGKPRHLIVDRGGEFIADGFRDLIAALGVQLRFCSAENHRANARLERFWLTLKRSLGLVPPVPHVTEVEIQRAITYYAFFRPHRGLDGATPAEVYFGEPPRHLRAVQPPRGVRGAPSIHAPFAIDCLDGDRRFPILREAA